MIGSKRLRTEYANKHNFFKGVIQSFDSYIEQILIDYFLYLSKDGYENHYSDIEKEIYLEVKTFKYLDNLGFDTTKDHSSDHFNIAATLSTTKAE